jgi:hypothetical protein
MVITLYTILNSNFVSLSLRIVIILRIRIWVCDEVVGVEEEDGVVCGGAGPRPPARLAVAVFVSRAVAVTLRDTLTQHKLNDKKM